MREYAVLIILLALVVLGGLWAATTRTAVAPASTSGVRGTVLLGPICPVERIPPEPQCAPKPYATSIAVYRAGSTSVFATGTSDANGAFTLPLPPGSYTIKAAGGTTLPRCTPMNIAVTSSGYASTTISCDTGIR